MHLVRSATLVVCLLGLAACAGAPRNAGYPYTVEQKMQSVHHWEILAQRVVETQVSPAVSSPLSAAAPAVRGQVYVDDSDRTDFGRAFHGYIITDLVKRGIPIARDPDAAIVVEWGTQLVTHSKPVVEFPGVIPGTFEVVGAALVGSSIFVPPSEIEVIVTTQVVRYDTIISRETHNFYINDDGKWNFWQPKQVAQK